MEFDLSSGVALGKFLNRTPCNYTSLFYNHLLKTVDEMVDILSVNCRTQRKKNVVTSLWVSGVVAELPLGLTLMATRR